MMSALYRIAASKIGTPSDLGIPENTLDRAALDTFLNGVYFIAGFVAVVIIIIASINYVTSAGDTNKITKAKNTILYAAIGLVFVIGAFAITNYVLAKG